MKPETQLVLDATDEEVVQILVQLGLARNEARVVVYLAQVDEAVSRQVEQGADMRQPEVSTAMRELRRRGWVAKRDVKREGKGRPLHCYRLAVAFDAALDDLEQARRDAFERDLARLDRARAMAEGFEVHEQGVPPSDAGPQPEPDDHPK